MKKILLLFAVVGMLFSGCGKDDISDLLNDLVDTLPDLPEVTDEEDICDKMDDMVFITYCYQHLDANRDGVFSIREAETVRAVNLENLEDDATVYSVKGIEYFKNLNSFKAPCAGLLELDLRYNENLAEIDCSYCKLLQKVQLPNIDKIGSYAFRGCSSLQSITIPDSVTSIGEWAFNGCSSLTEVFCKPTTPPTGGDHMFSNYDHYSGYEDIGCTIYVPTDSVEAYKAASGWSDYAEYIVGKEF